VPRCGNLPISSAQPNGDCKPLPYPSDGREGARHIDLRTEHIESCHAGSGGGVRFVQRPLPTTSDEGVLRLTSSKVVSRNSRSHGTTTVSTRVRIDRTTCPRHRPAALSRAKQSKKHPYNTRPSMPCANPTLAHSVCTATPHPPSHASQSRSLPRQRSAGCSSGGRHATRTHARSMLLTTVPHAPLTTATPMTHCTARTPSSTPPCLRDNRTRRRGQACLAPCSAPDRALRDVPQMCAPGA
jgi:hypothetical protein